MLALIIRKEVLSHVLSLRFAVGFILLLVLVIGSITVSVNEYEQNVAEYQARVHAQDDALKEVMADEEDRFWRLFRWEGKLDAVPVFSLSWLGQGIQPSLPAAIRSWPNRTESVSVGLMRNPLRGLLRIPDFVYVVNVVLSFLAVLFIFDAVCGEKQAGTLRLMLSNAVPRHTVLLGKWIGGYLVLVVPFLLAAGGGLLFARSRGVLGASDVSRALIIMAVACLYIGAFFNVGLFVSTVASRPATALLVCLFIWVLSVLVIPNMAPVTAKILQPTPSLDVISAEKRHIDQEIDIRKARLTLTSGELSYGKKIEEAKDKLDREKERRINQLDQYYEDSRAHQVELARTLGRLSPSACWTLSALALAKTGPAAYERLQEARNKLGSDFEKLRQRLDRKRREKKDDDWSEFPIEEVPRLSVREPGLGESLNVALNDVLILAIGTVLFFMLGFMFFLRYDVR